MHSQKHLIRLFLAALPPGYRVCAVSSGTVIIEFLGCLAEYACGINNKTNQAKHSAKIGSVLRQLE